jgi:hypothetical protein
MFDMCSGDTEWDVLRLAPAGRTSRLSPISVYYYEAQAIFMYKCNTTDTNCDLLALNTNLPPNKGVEEKIKREIQKQARDWNISLRTS